MTRALFVDDTSDTTLVADLVRQRLGWEVEVVHRAGAIDEQFLAGSAYDIACVDLSFPAEDPMSGLDVLLALRQFAPTVTRVVRTDGDPSKADLLVAAWHALPVDGAIGKGMPIDHQITVLDRLHRGEKVAPDPMLQVYLPDQRDPMRSAEAYRRLVPYSGVARMWTALWNATSELSYDELAERSALKRNAVRAYRQQLVPELELHGVEDTSLRSIQRFARRSRPLLQPFVDQKLAS